MSTKVRYPTALKNLMQVLATHGFVKNLPQPLVQLLGLEWSWSKSHATIVSGLSLQLLLATLGRWLELETVSWSEAKRQVHADMGRKDEKLLAEIERVLDPTQIFKDLLRLHGNDEACFRKAKQDAEIVEQVGLLHKKLCGA